MQVRGKVSVRGNRKRADYLLYFQPNLPLAVIGAKDGTFEVGSGMSQAPGYADVLNVPSSSAPTAPGSSSMTAPPPIGPKGCSSAWTPSLHRRTSGLQAGADGSDALLGLSTEEVFTETHMFAKLA